MEKVTFSMLPPLIVIRVSDPKVELLGGGLIGGILHGKVVVTLTLLGGGPTNHPRCGIQCEPGW